MQKLRHKTSNSTVLYYQLIDDLTGRGGMDISPAADQDEPQIR